MANDNSVIITQSPTPVVTSDKILIQLTPSSITPQNKSYLPLGVYYASPNPNTLDRTNPLLWTNLIVPLTPAIKVLIAENTNAFITSVASTADIALTVSPTHQLSGLLTVTGVVAGGYGSASDTLTASVDSKGRISAISAVAIAIDASQITTGILPYPRGGTGLGTLGTVGQSIRVNAGATGYEFYTPSTGSVTSVSGTANRITSTGGTTPIIDISAAYVGQSSITTVGALTAGSLAVGFTVVPFTVGGTGLSALGTAFQSLRVNAGASALEYYTPTSGTVTSVSGTANRITVATGTTTPVIDISAAYVGQTSITTLGTVGTGIWNGTAVTVPFGGTGASSFTAYSVLCAGTTSTGAFQNVSGVGTSGQVLTSAGAAALPTWTTLSATSLTVGTTAIVSGTVGRVLYEGAGNVLQESANLFWDNSNVRLGIGGTPTGTLTVFSSSGGANSGISLTQVANSGTAATSYVPIDFTVPTTGLAGQFLLTANNYVNAATNLPANSIALLTYATSGALLLGSTGASGNIRFDVGGVASGNEIARITTTGFGISTTAPHSTLHSGASFATGYVAKTAAYTAALTDCIIEATANTFAFTLPTAVGISGRWYALYNSGAGVISINTTSAQTVGGVASGGLTMATNKGYLVTSNGANWLVFGTY